MVEIISLCFFKTCKKNKPLITLANLENGNVLIKKKKASLNQLFAYLPSSCHVKWESSFFWGLGSERQNASGSGSLQYIMHTNYRNGPFT